MRLSVTVDEMLLVREASDIGKRQDDDREARRAGFLGSWGRREAQAAAVCRLPGEALRRISSSVDNTELGRAEIANCEDRAGP